MVALRDIRSKAAVTEVATAAEAEVKDNSVRNNDKWAAAVGTSRARSTSYDIDISNTSGMFSASSNSSTCTVSVHIINSSGTFNVSRNSSSGPYSVNSNNSCGTF